MINESEKVQKQIQFEIGTKYVFDELCKELAISGKDMLAKKIQFEEYKEEYYDYMEELMCVKAEPIDEREYYRYEVVPSDLERVKALGACLDDDGRVYFSISKLREMAFVSGFDMNIGELSVDSSYRNIKESIKILSEPKIEEPKDVIEYYRQLRNPKFHSVSIKSIPGNVIGRKCWKKYGYDICFGGLTTEKDIELEGRGSRSRTVS